MVKKIAAATVLYAILLSQCNLNEPEKAVFTEGNWREIAAPSFGVSNYFITVARDSFYLENRIWATTPLCNDTICTGTYLNTFAKGIIAVPGDQMVTFSGISTDSIFTPLVDSSGNQVPFYELYLYTWIGDTLVLVTDNGSDHKQRKMVNK